MIPSIEPRGAQDAGFERLLAVLRQPDGFVKIHGLGNDFIVVDGRTHPFRPNAARIAGLCNRHTGIGGDQLLVLEPPASSDEDLRLRIYNIDGAEAQTCLNATRCVAWLALKALGRDTVRIGTLGGTIEGSFANGNVVTLRLAPARFDWQGIPLAEPRDTLALDLTAGPLTAQAAVNIGNPHIVCFVPSLAEIDVPRHAAQLQAHPLLPEGANVGVAEIVDDMRMRLVVWERPGILTRACGSGACAALAAARRLNRTTARRMQVEMPGGTLAVEEAVDGTLSLTGAVEVAFLGLLP